MQTVMIIGAGRIGKLIALLLANSRHYRVLLIDQQSEEPAYWLNHKSITYNSCNVTNHSALIALSKEKRVSALVSALPYQHSMQAVLLADKLNVPYFDLTEDRELTNNIKKIAKQSQSILVPQCGLAPGLVGIIAHTLIREFDDVKSVELRTGALPQQTHHPLGYALTWSTDGLINQYCNSCIGLVQGKISLRQPLDECESLEIDGGLYEAFNTSGGIGSLAELYENKVKTLNYKTIRYPGHCEKVRFLLHDLKLCEKRDLTKAILENALTQTKQDVVIIYISVEGRRNQTWHQKTYVNKIYPQTIADHHFSAIQIATAASLCAVLELVFNQLDAYVGFIYQEQFTLDQVLKTRFGSYLKGEN